MEIPRNKKEGEHVKQAQETALVALQHGYKLTAGQKNLLDHMDPKDKKVMEERIKKVVTFFYLKKSWGIIPSKITLTIQLSIIWNFDRSWYK